MGEFLRSLDVAEALDARLCLAGHGRVFVDVGGHIEGNRGLVSERLHAVERALADVPRTVMEIVPDVYAEPLTAANAALLLTQTLCYLRHLELAGAVEHVGDADTERWRRV